MSYLKRFRTRRVPQSAPLPGQVGANTRGRLRLGGRRLDAPAPLPDPRLRGRQLLRGRVRRSRARTPTRSSAASRRRTARGRSRDRRGQRRGPRAEERPGDLRARDGGRRRATRRRAAPRSRRCRRCAAPARTCSSSRRSSRASAAGAARCAARSARWYAAPLAGRARLPGGQVPPARGRRRTATCCGSPTRRGAWARATRRSTVSTSTLACSSGSSAAARRTACRAWSRASRRAQAADDAERGGRSSCASTACRARRSRPSTSTSPEVWEALLEDMPMTALVRNLATMTRVGVLAPGSDGDGARSSRSSATRERIRRARVHPIAVLAALRTYAAGRGVRGRAQWTPGAARSSTRSTPRSTRRSSNVEPTGKRMLLALDVSGSMAGGDVAGVPGLTPRDASAAMALVTAATEPRHEMVGFYAGKGGFRKRGRAVYCGYTDGLTPLAISRGSGWTTPCERCRDLPFGGTDCALPMLYALATRARGRHVRDLHRQRDLGGRRAPGAGARATTAGRRASTRGWSWSAWSRTASRSRTRTTRACSTSSASTPRRRS